jgi:hypothetical protein
MPKTQLPDDDAALGNAAVPELDDDALTESDDETGGEPGERGKDDLMQDEEDTDGNV